MICSCRVCDKEVLDKMAEVVNGPRDDIFWAYDEIVSLLQGVREIDKEFQA